MRQAAEVEGRHPGWTVTYGLFGFTARCGGQELHAAAPRSIESQIQGADDAEARRIEAEFPGRTVEHGPYGWTARRDGRETVRAQTCAGLRALLPFCGD